jgi:sarcosine oxidase subunit beta
MQNQLGVQTEFLSGDEVRRRLPLMRFDDAIAGTFNQKDGTVDPNSVVMGYVNAAQKMGVTALTGAEVIGVTVSGGEVRSVKTNLGEIEARTILNAAGPWSGLIGAMAGVHIPVTPLRRQMFTTNPLKEVPEDFPFVIDFAKSLYFHREGEGLLIGMSNQNEKPGFDQNVDEDFELVNLEAAIVRSDTGCTSHLRRDRREGLFALHWVFGARLYARTDLWQVNERIYFGRKIFKRGCFDARPETL